MISEFNNLKKKWATVFMRHYANVSSSFTIRLSEFWYLPGSFQRVSKVTSTEICKLFKPKMTENEMVGWHHWLNGHESEQTLEAGDGQRSLVCCSPWGHKESDTTEWLNWIISSLKWSIYTAWLSMPEFVSSFRSVSFLVPKVPSFFCTLCLFFDPVFPSTSCNS